MEMGEDAVVANICTAVKVTGGVDTEGPLRRLCGKPAACTPSLGFRLGFKPASSVPTRIARFPLASGLFPLGLGAGEVTQMRDGKLGRATIDSAEAEVRGFSMA